MSFITVHVYDTYGKGCWYENLCEIFRITVHVELKICQGSPKPHPLTLSWYGYIMYCHNKIDVRSVYFVFIYDDVFSI